MSDPEMTSFGAFLTPEAIEQARLEYEKELLVWAIKGKGARGPYLWGHKEFEAAGLLCYTGNQHNPAWTWQTERLSEIELSQLRRLYRELSK